MRENKMVYIASPYAGDVEKNVIFARKACRYAAGKGHTPIAVHLMYPQFLDDGNPMERSLGLRLGLRILMNCDELWLCGEHLSTGMSEEEEFAKKLSIPIRHVPSGLIEEGQRLAEMQRIKPCEVKTGLESGTALEPEPERSQMTDVALA